MKEESGGSGNLPELPSGKDIKDIADAASTSVDTVAKAAKFIDGMFGNAISNAFGLISDKLAYYRLEKAVELHCRRNLRNEA